MRVTKASGVFGLFLCTLAALSLLATPSIAATLTWSNSGTTWSTASNWGGTAPGSSDIGLFNLNAAYTYQPSLTSAAAVGGVWDTGSGPVTIGGSPLTLNGTTINSNPGEGIELDPGAGALTVSASVGLGGPQTWLNNSSSLVTVSGNVGNAGNLLTVSGSGNTTVSGVVSGAGGLAVLSGSTTLTGENTLTGLVTISGGTLNAANTHNGNGQATFDPGANPASPSTLNISIGRNGTLVASAVDSIFGYGNSEPNWPTITCSGLMLNTAANNVHIGPLVLSGGTLASTTIGSGYGSWCLDYNVTATANSYITAPNVALAGNRGAPISRTFTVNPGATLDVTGYLRNGGGSAQNISTLILTGGGTMVLANVNNTYTGGTTVTAGTLQLGDGVANNGSVTSAILDNSAVIFANPASQSFGVIISGSGSVTTNGPGTLILAGAQTYTGSTNVQAGKLYINGTISSASAQVYGGATLGGMGSVGVAGSTCNVTVLNGGSLESGQAGVGNLTLNGNLTLGVNSGDTAAINIFNLPTAPTTLQVNGNITALGGSSSVTINCDASPYASNTYSLISYTGSLNNFSALSVAPAHLGIRSIATLSNLAGQVTVQIQPVYPVWNGGNGSNAWNTTAQNQNWLLNSNGVNGAATSYVEGDSVMFDDTPGSNSVVIVSANVRPSSVLFNNNLYSYTLQGSAGIVGPANLTVNGVGAVTIANSNSYTGGTTLNAGLLNIGNSAALGSAAGTITVNGGSIDNTSGVAITLPSYPIAWNGSFGFAGSSPLNLGSGAVTLGNSVAVNVSGSTLTVGGAIGGSGYGLTETGAGLLVLTASSGYSGPTVVSGGTLQFGTGNSGHDGSIASSSGITNNSQLVYNLSGSQSYTQVISGAGGVTLLGGALTLTAANTFTGGTTITGGTLTAAYAGGNSIGTFPVSSPLAFINIGPAGTLVASAGNAVFGYAPAGGNNSAANWPTLTNAGVMNDTAGANVHVGPLVLSGGTMMASAPGDSYGTWQLNSTVNVTANSLISAAGVSLGGNQNAPGQRTFTINQGVSLDVTGSFRNNVSNQSGAWGITLNGPGTMILAGTNAYTGATQVYNGTLQVASSAAFNYGQVAGITYNASTLLNAGSVVLDNGYASTTGGTLDLDGNTVSIGALSGVTSLGLVANSASGTLATLIVGNNNATSAYAGGLADNVGSGGVISGGSLALTKTGTGTLVITGYNTYSGSTAVNSGNISVNGGAILGTSSVTVNGGTSNAASLYVNGGTISTTGQVNVNGGSLYIGSGAVLSSGSTAINSGSLGVDGLISSTGALKIAGGVTLSGSGSVGNTTVLSGGTLTAGDLVTVAGQPLGVGTLTMNSLTLGANTGNTATINILNGASIANPQAPPTNLQVNGNVTALGGSGSVTIDVNSTPATGTYGILDYTGTLNNFSAFALAPIAGIGARSTAKLVNLPGEVGLDVQIAYPVWTGAHGTAWNTSTVQNWELNTNGAPTYYIQGDAVVFDDTPGSNSVVSISASNVFPASVNFNNGSVAYTLTGSFGIAGSGSLSVNGTNGSFGGLTIATSNSYTGGTNINANGTVTLANANALPSGPAAGNVILNPSAAAILDLDGTPVVNINGLSGGGGTSLGQVINSATGTVATLNVGIGNGTATFAGTIADYNFSGGQVALTKSGSGMETLTALNTYTGLTAINGGTLALTAGGVLSGLTGTGTLLLPTSNNLSVGNTDVTTTFAGVVTGLGGLTKIGSGTLTLTGPNSYTGATTITSGTLQFGNGSGGNDGSISSTSGILNNSALVYNLFGSQTYSGVISGQGSLTLLGGALTLTNANTFIGGTTITGGTLTAGYPGGRSTGTFPAGTSNASIYIGPAGTLVASQVDSILGYAPVGNDTAALWPTVNCAGVLIDSASANVHLGPLVLSGGTLAASAPSADVYGTWNLDSDVNVTANSLISAAGVNIGGNQNVVGNYSQRSFTINPGVTLDVTGTLRNNNYPNGVSQTGNWGINVLGGGTMILAGANGYTGPTYIIDGTLQVANSAAFNYGQAAGVPNSSTAGEVWLDNGSTAGTLDLNGYQVNIGGLWGSSGSGQVINSAAGTTATLIVGNNDATAVFNGIILDNSGGGGRVALVKTGSGMQTLQGPNSFSGGTTIAAGTLQLGTSNALGSGGLTANGGELDMNGNSISVPSLSGAAGTISDESYSNGTTTLTVAQSSTTAFGGTIRDGLNGTLVALTLDGAGELILSATNSYSGGTVVEAGTLVADNSAALPAGSSLTVGAGGTSLFSPSLGISSLPEASLAVSSATAIAAVPEPGSAALLLVGATLLLLYRRRQSRSCAVR
jgi:autotransporter-associated beta strand protein